MRGGFGLDWTGGPHTMEIAQALHKAAEDDEIELSRRRDRHRRTGLRGRREPAYVACCCHCGRDTIDEAAEWELSGLLRHGAS